MAENKNHFSHNVDRKLTCQSEKKENQRKVKRNERVKSSLKSTTPTVAMKSKNSSVINLRRIRLTVNVLDFVSRGLGWKTG